MQWEGAKGAPAFSFFATAREQDLGGALSSCGGEYHTRRCCHEDIREFARSPSLCLF